MIPLLLTALFPETGPTELADLARDLGFAGLDLAVGAASAAEVERSAGIAAEAGMPAVLLTVDTADPTALREWALLAAHAGMLGLRTPPLALEPHELPARLDALAAAAAETGIPLLVPHHPGSAIPDVGSLGVALAGHPPLAAMLQPDYMARSRAGDHAAWLARLPLPRIGAVSVAAYRWDSEIGSGNLRVWSPRAAHLLHGLTPWQAWLHRLAETDFDGPFTFGDAALTGTLGERLRTVRDDLRVVRRTWRGGQPAPPTA